jgi:hypothetical protein
VLEKSEKEDSLLPQADVGVSMQRYQKIGNCDPSTCDKHTQRSKQVERKTPHMTLRSAAFSFLRIFLRHGIAILEQGLVFTIHA